MLIRIGYDIALRLPAPTGDIGVPADPNPMDFSAWFEAYLGGHCHTFDARHNRRRIGRVLIGRGRDASDVPITMAFGQHLLENFSVVTEKIDPGSTANAVGIATLESNAGVDCS